MTFAVSRGVEALIAPGCRAPWQSVHVDERSRFASQCFALRNSHVTLAQLHISRNDVSRKTCFNGRINDHSHDTQSSSMCRAVTEGSKIRVGDYSKKMERIANVLGRLESTFREIFSLAARERAEGKRSDGK